MLLNVYSTETKGVIQVDSSKLNPEVHLHRNTLEAFSKKDLKSFDVK